MKKIDAKAIAFVGIYLALSVVTLFGATITPGIELTLYGLSSFYISFIMIEISTTAGILLYFATMMLASIILPDKGGLVPYILFFGLYAIVKYYIENNKKISQPIEIILKFLFFNTTFFIGIIIFASAFMGAIHLPDVALPIIVVGAQIFFLAYDYIFTLVIGFYMKRRPKV